MAKDPYKLLGVERKAGEADIRKAYRALAKKLHPDVNPDNPKAAERFKEVTAAYTLLTDKDLRARYDSGQVDASGQQQSPFGAGGFGQGGFGQGGFRQGRGPMGGGPFAGSARGGGQDDMSELFSSLFGMNMNSMRGGMEPRRAAPKKGADIRYKLSLTFIEALQGGTRHLSSGLKVKIPAGVEAGQTLRLRGKGKPGTHGGPAGDAKVDIAVETHKYFSRDGRKLRLTLPISVHEAVLGAKIKIPMPSGSVQLSIPAGSNSGQVMRLKGKGVAGGDLYVTLQIVLDGADQDRLRDWAENNPMNTEFDPRHAILSS